MRSIFIASFAVLLAACNVEQYEPIAVAVYPSTKTCTIKDKPLDCGKMADYVRDTLKAKADREISVSYAGSEAVPKDDTSLEQIAALIKTAGYVNVRVIRFDMK